MAILSHSQANPHGGVTYPPEQSLIFIIQLYSCNMACKDALNLLNKFIYELTLLKSFFRKLKK